MCVNIEWLLELEKRYINAVHLQLTIYHKQQMSDRHNAAHSHCWCKKEVKRQKYIKSTATVNSYQVKKSSHTFTK